MAWVDVALAKMRQGGMTLADSSRMKGGAVCAVGVFWGAMR